MDGSSGSAAKERSLRRGVSTHTVSGRLERNGGLWSMKSWNFRNLERPGGHYMKSFLKWGLIAFLALAVLGALFGKDDQAGQTKEASATTSIPSTPESTRTETSTPGPTPDPEVSVNYTGPFKVHSDSVILKGTVDPANAHVRVKGESVKVRHGHWTLPVTLTKHGDNKFRVVATRKGYVKSSTTTTCRGRQLLIEALLGEPRVCEVALR